MAVAENKAVLNTTINKCIFDKFKDYCKSTGCPMNVIIEAFMTQFANGEFTIRIGKSSIGLDLDE